MTDSTDGDCIFCRIASGVASADIVRETDDTVWFRDIAPKARVHLLGIPRRHISSLADVAGTDGKLVSTLLREAVELAQEAGIAAGGYRVITNIGPDSGQEVPHLHFHVLGGESLGPLRC